MKIQTKNKIFTTLVVLISLFFTIASIYALTNYFSKQRKEKIQLMNNLPFSLLNEQVAIMKIKPFYQFLFQT